MTTDDGQTNKRVKMIKHNGGNALARRPVGRPDLGESHDRYHGDLEAYTASEIERLVTLAAENKYRARLRFEQLRTEKRIDKLLGQDQQEDGE